MKVIINKSLKLMEWHKTATKNRKIKKQITSVIINKQLIIMRKSFYYVIFYFV